MIRTFFKIAIRNIFKNRTYSLVNTVGLSTGIAFSVLLFSWILNELNTDKFHAGSDSIYLVGTDFVYPEKTVQSSCAPYPLGIILKQENPEIEKLTRFVKVPMPLNIKVGDNVFYENSCACTDSAFFNLFSFKTVIGDFKGVLNSPSDVVLSERAAKKYFGDANPIGKKMTVQNQYPLVVRGVFKNLPANSQFDFDIAMSYNIIENFNPHCFEWISSGTNTWIKLNKNTNVEAFSSKIKNTIVNHRPDLNQLVHLISLKDYYFDLGYDMTYTKKGNRQYVILLAIVAVFILVVAVVNFVNLSTAISGRRYKEIGLKKTMGSSGGRISVQFMAESFLTVFIAILISVMLFNAALPFFEKLLGSSLVLKDYLLQIVIIFGIIQVVVGILGGIYPAAFLSSKPLTVVFKDPSKQFSGKFSLEKFLVVVQFSIAVFMIIGTLVVGKQINHVMTQNLGFDKESIMMVKSNPELASKYARFKEDMQYSNSVSMVSCIDIFPAYHDNKTSSFWWEGKSPNQEFEIAYSYVDADFMKLMGISFVEGRDFNARMGADFQSAFIINDKAREIMGLTNVVNTSLQFFKQHGKIIGLIENPLFHSLHTEAKPRLFIPVASSADMPQMRSGGDILIKARAGELNAAVNEIKEWCKNNNILVAPEFHFLDSTYEAMYKKERRIAKVFSLFSLFSILISCIGVFILNSFYTQKKSKEIAVRRINGAEIFNIYKEILSYMVKWIFVSIVLAIPVSVFVLNKWLENFAYKTNLSWWIFAFAGVLALGIALLTVSWQSWRAATRNPVEALRYE
uniref:ABC transporter permease n=1 Tax=uncultured Draconibacterium sp. TaxID=1573823 RepID=UPI003216A550